MLLLDTCILIDGLHALDEPAGISVVSMVELQSGLGAAPAATERARRQERYDGIARRFEPLPVDDAVLARYGRVDAAVRAVDRRPRSRLADLLIASTALAHGLALLTHNTDDFRGLEDLLEVRAP